MTGLTAIVRSGPAVAALARTSVPSDVRPIPHEAGLPDLPSLEIGLVSSGQAVTSASDDLARAIRHTFSLSRRGDRTLPDRMSRVA